MYSTSPARSVMTLGGPSQIIQLFMSLAGFLNLLQNGRENEVHCISYQPSPAKS